MEIMVYITDCEGPVSKNDNAFELAQHFIHDEDGEEIDGGELYTILSSYDDLLAYVIKREGYEAGYTLKMILPFLKAYGVNGKVMEEYSRRNLILIPKVGDVLHELNSLNFTTYIISTSYRPYIKALCDVIKFPLNRVYCTEINLDEVNLSINEVKKLKRICLDLVSIPKFKINDLSKTSIDLDRSTLESIKRLDEIFLREIPMMNAGRLMSEAKVLGSKGKAKALTRILERESKELSDVIYVGDSITDVNVMRTVKEGGGISIAFNGNIYAVKEANIAVLSETAEVMIDVARTFMNEGKEGVMKLAGDEGDYSNGEGSEGRILKVTKRNFRSIASISTLFRRRVRGEKVGRLG